MIDYHRFCQIKDLHAHQGLTASQIAHTLALDRVLWLTGSPRALPTPQITPRASKLAPFKPQIVQMLDKYPYSAAQVFQRLREAGLCWRYSIVKAYVRTVRPKRQPAFLKLAFAPGECAQVDWGSFGSVSVGHTSRRLSFFVIVLCYRPHDVCGVHGLADHGHFLACHQHAFEFFGGIPKKVMVDNLNPPCSHAYSGKRRCSIPSISTLPRTAALPLPRVMSARAMKKGRVENGVAM